MNYATKLYICNWYFTTVSAKKSEQGRSEKGAHGPKTHLEDNNQTKLTDSEPLTTNTVDLGHWIFK